MADKLIQKIKEFIEISKSCPDNLQEKCFDLLLSDYLFQLRTKSSGAGETLKHTNPARDESKKEDEKKAKSQEDIEEKDIHVKAKKFLNKAGLTIENINQLFYKEGEKFLPLYDELKTTKASESQIRIALLQAFLSGLSSGEFEFNGELVREEAQIRKCYDTPNFAAHFKNNKELFDGFTKYKKSSPTIKLSPQGKTKLAEIIKDFQ
jgi:hypothetical protein